MLSVKMRQTKFGDDAEAKKTLAEATQLLESVLVQSSKSTLTSETLKTKLRKVLEKLQDLSKENGKDDTELREISQRKFDRSRISGVVDAKDEEAAKSGLAKLYELIVWTTCQVRRDSEVESGQARCVEP